MLKIKNFTLVVSDSQRHPNLKAWMSICRLTARFSLKSIIEPPITASLRRGGSLIGKELQGWYGGGTCLKSCSNIEIERENKVARCENT